MLKHYVFVNFPLAHRLVDDRAYITIIIARATAPNNRPFADVRNSNKQSGVIGIPFARPRV